MGNETVDTFFKNSSKMEQPNPQVTHKETKTVKRNQYRPRCSERLNIDMVSDPDQKHESQRHQQTILFHLRTGHCRLLSHLYRLKTSHTDTCARGDGARTPPPPTPRASSSIVPSLQTYLATKDKPEAETVGPPCEGLERTVDFILAIRLPI